MRAIGSLENVPIEVLELIDSFVCSRGSRIATICFRLWRPFKKKYVQIELPNWHTKYFFDIPTVLPTTKAIKAIMRMPHCCSNKSSLSSKIQNLTSLDLSVFSCATGSEEPIIQWLVDEWLQPSLRTLQHLSLQISLINFGNHMKFRDRQRDVVLSLLPRITQLLTPRSLPQLHKLSLKTGIEKYAPECYLNGDSLHQCIASAPPTLQEFCITFLAQETAILETVVLSCKKHFKHLKHLAIVYKADDNNTADTLIGSTFMSTVLTRLAEIVTLQGVSLSLDNTKFTTPLDLDGLFQNAPANFMRFNLVLRYHQWYYRDDGYPLEVRISAVPATLKVFELDSTTKNCRWVNGSRPDFKNFTAVETKNHLTIVPKPP
eukprot:TRINITY_DN9146_c0_g1_i1.p1 TRINITY_DN9146_c0_g1~~TRINITY_DN9146_c0_g1_i1.p1  ORF type:complete len:382 (+),score=7.05 TRINITY_DN9146_c0_g1_i1:23-1147(+)